MPHIFRVSLACLMLLMSGCGQGEPDRSAPAASRPPRRAAVKLTILVVDDPDLAAGINLLRGEWAVQSGGELEVQELSVNELLELQELSSDLVIYPSRYLGTLVDRKWLRPVRNSLLKDNQFDLQDYLPLVRDRVMRYGGEIFALSLGEPPLVLAWEDDLPPGIPSDGSMTWTQFDQLEVGRSQDSPLEYPLAARFIVRAVTYSDRTADAAVLFDPQTMVPRLLDPPFVRALQELVAMEQNASSSGGQPKVWMSWPTAPIDGDQNDPQSPRTFSSIPQADKVYARSLQTWVADEASGRSPTFLGFSGRLASVTQASRNAVSAFKLLEWLTRGETAIQLSSRSNATVWFRSSQMSQAQSWLRERRVSEAAKQSVTRLLSTADAYLLPRMLGIDRYLQSLDQTVAGVVSGNVEVEAALRKATSDWLAITQSLGADRQRAAYRKHLGFEDSAE